MTGWDKILIGCIVCISIFFLVRPGIPAEEQRDIVVTVNGEEVYRTSFSKEITEKKIESPYGYNVIEIGEDYVRVLDASCPNKLDVKQGKIHSPGQSIICIPNRMVVTIEGQSDGPDVMSR
ncbi:MAG: NusG domain II-containing protein [Tissierellia bacterium]|nr:NusG domain II-containing protein [Tissierellia bacterium]